MTDTPSSPRKGVLDFLSNAADLVRLIQTIAVILIAIVVYLDQSKAPADGRCRGLTAVGILTAAVGPSFSAEIADNLRAYARRCEEDADGRHIFEVAASQLASGGASTVPAEMAALLERGGLLRPQGGGAVVIGTLPPSAVEKSIGVARPSAPSGAGSSAGGGVATTEGQAAPKEGWVAVGFLDGDASFDIVSGHPLAALADKDVIVAKQPVNLRKKAADWTTPLAVLSTGQKATLVEPPKILKAGSLRQVWAHVRLD